MPRVKYEPAEDVKLLAQDIVKKLKMKWIRIENLGFLRSYGSHSMAVARIYGLPRPFQVAFNLQPLYVIEVVSERFDRLVFEKKVEVVIHELLHIPSSFSGGLRPHGSIVNNKKVKLLKEKYLKRRLARS
ncbi:MAG: putative metallopeptidase [Infirmifilum sp.]